jgi:hypothetical protein
MTANETGWKIWKHSTGKAHQWKNCERYRAGGVDMEYMVKLCRLEKVQKINLCAVGDTHPRCEICLAVLRGEKKTQTSRDT